MKKLLLLAFASILPLCSLFAQSSYKEYMKLAKQGDVWAQFELAQCYQNGSGGAKQDYAKAVRWYEMVIDGAVDDPIIVSAQWNLAFIYYEGKGVAKNYSEAAKLFKEVYQVDHSAGYMVGECYYYGRGVEQDYA